MRNYLIALLALAAPLSAQEARGTILGRVSDPSGAVIGGAKVEAANVETGVRFTSNTNRSGDYTFPLLLPGAYTVKVEQSGFKTYSRTGVAVRVNDQVTIDITMEVGQSSQTVQVNAETPLLDTSAATIGYVVDSRTIMELPSLLQN